MKRLSSIGAIVLLSAGAAVAGHLDISQVDSDGDNFASWEEMRAALPQLHEQAFREMDTNGDNRLSSNEINRLAAQRIIAQHPTGGSASRTVDLLDTDGDGFISYEDVTRVYPAFSMLSFREVDANGDNRLSHAEFYTPVMQQRIAACSHDDAVDMGALDANGDNFVDMSEMQAMMPGLHQADFQTVDTNDDNRISSNELMAPGALCTLGGH